MTRLAPGLPVWGSRRTWLRAALAISILAVAGVGGRHLMNGRFHPFGESLSIVSTSERVVALSFDDGPHPTNTPLMLDILDRHSVRATFFMMGRNVERWPDVVRDVAARGHEVGNHSYSHPALILMRPARVREEIERTDSLLRARRDTDFSGSATWRD